MRRPPPPDPFEFLPEGGDAGVPEPDPVELPIDGVLDLHTFRPGDVKVLIPEYVRLCREKGLLDLRIIHGKGTGALCRTVQALLRQLPDVEAFRLADESAGSWGATIVRLRANTR